MKTKIISFLTALTVAIILAGCGMPGGQSPKETKYQNVQFTDVKINSLSSDEKVTAVACGDYFSFVLTNKGNLYATGDNSSGQLGLGDYNSRNYLTLSATNVKQVACGSKHSLIIKTDGYVYAAGWNFYGQYGNGNNSSQSSWTNTGLSAILIACGSCYSLAIGTDWYVYGTGLNDRGQLGINNFDYNKLSWTKSSLQATAIACGNAHSLAVGADHYVYGTGYNGSGQLGLNDNNDRYSWANTGLYEAIIACGGDHSLAAKYDYTVWGTGYDAHGELGFDCGGSVMSWTKTSLKSLVIACGDFHSLGMDSISGYVYAAGYNAYGQLGLGYDNGDNLNWMKTSLLKPTGISCGNFHSLAIGSDGNAYAVGGNTYGQLGIGNYTNQYTWCKMQYFQEPPNNVSVSLENYWQPGKFINVEHRINHTVECGPKQDGWLSAKWEIKKVVYGSDTYYTFKCRWNKTNNGDGYDYYLHMEDAGQDGSQWSYVEWDKRDSDGTGPNEGWQSAQWKLEQTGIANCYRFRNRWTGHYMWIEHLYPAGYLSVVKLEHSELPDTTVWDPDSAKWYIRVQ